jgi:hypothetical protein
VLRTVAYSDVFDHPLTAEEIWRTLPVAASLDDTREALGREVAAARLGRTAAYYCLSGREALAATRERRRTSSAKLLRRAKFWGRVLAAMPYVRMVAVTGSLAVESAEAGEDVDYFIVTTPRRVWTARAFVTAVVYAARPTGVELCPNFVLAADSLALPEEDAYVARELAQMLPIAGTDVAQTMLDANAWWRGFLPNARPAADAVEPSSSPLAFVRPVLEVLLGGRAGDRLEASLLRSKGGALRRAAGDNPEARFDEAMCKGHVDSHRRRIAEALARRLAVLGLDS